MYAIQECEEEVVSVLVEKGADVNAQSEVSPHNNYNTNNIHTQCI